MKKRRTKSKRRRLPDDLVVEILSRVPLKSFCRFKCVCKARLAFSSDPHYRRKLPKVPTGLLYKDQHVQLLSLSPPNPGDEGIDTSMPDSKRLELVDCCNGLVLCRYKSNRDPSPDTSRLVVYNPATGERRALPVASDPYVPQDTLDMIDADHLTHSSLDYTTFLGFDPSWSAELYVFSFQEVLIRSMNAGIIGLEVFDSVMSSCFVDEDWIGESLLVGRAHIFVGGVLYVETYNDVILVVQGLEEMSHTMDYHSTIKLPDGCEGGGCFGLSSGLLQCAFPEKGGRTIAVFSLDAACNWSTKHRFSMRDAFGRDGFVGGAGSHWPRSCDYQIIAIDLEREVLLLLDKRPKKLLSYGINTGKLCEIKGGHRPLRSYFSHLGFDLECHYYVACYSKPPRRAVYATTTN